MLQEEEGVGGGTVLEDLDLGLQMDGGTTVEDGGGADTPQPGGRSQTEGEQVSM